MAQVTVFFSDIVCEKNYFKFFQCARFRFSFRCLYYYIVFVMMANLSPASLTSVENSVPCSSS
jgi:hypothetical protein